MKINSTLTWLKSRDFLLIVLFLQCTLYIASIFGVYIVAQVIGFVYLTAVPGFIIIKLLKFEELDALETVLFSVGLSVAFLMLASLLINEFGFSLGISQPLSFAPLFIILNGLILLGAVLLYLSRPKIDLQSNKSLSLPPFALVFVCLPILSVLGAKWVNAFDLNSILMLMMIAISALFGIGVIFERLVPSKVYPFALLLIAISLLYHSSLISNYLVSFGSDVMVESFLLKTTLNSAHWSTTSLFSSKLFGRTSAMLSITILPSVYSNLLMLDPTWVYKSVSPLIFSLVPLSLYRVWSAYVGKKYAFISTFLFVAQSTFYTEMLGLNRQIIAELFFALLLLVILNKKMKPVNKMTLFIIFSVGLVTSHYALAEIFLFFISFALIFSITRSRILKRPSGNITVSMVVLFFVIMFTWYIYTSGSAVFNSFISFGSDVYNQLGEFSNLASRGGAVLSGLGVAEVPSIWNSISRAFAYITEALIAVGFLGSILKQTKIRSDVDYLMCTSAAMVLLAALILVPGLANTLNMTRFYHILLFFLAPLCAIGAEVIVNLVFKRARKLVVCLLLLIVLIPYFFFQTGFVYEITRTQNFSLPLGKHGMTVFLLAHEGYFYESEIISASWIPSNINVTNSKTYADPISASVLIGYGMNCGGNLQVLSNATTLSKNDNVYLDRMNVVDGIVPGSNPPWNTAAISGVWISANKIYANGESEIYKEMIGS